mgnify:CR=1 FL=1|jgi:dUTP pyrophosphatase
MWLLLSPQTDSIKKLYNDQKVNNYIGDSGFDLYCPEDVTINPGDTVCIDLQIQCAAFDSVSKAKNISFYLYPRSSIVKTPLRLANSVGVIDSGYRGNLKAFVDNIKGVPYKIEKGDRLFQICSPTLETVNFDLVNKLPNSERGSEGFGSTGR